MRPVEDYELKEGLIVLRQIPPKMRERYPELLADAPKGHLELVYDVPSLTQTGTVARAHTLRLARIDWCSFRKEWVVTDIHAPTTTNLDDVFWPNINVIKELCHHSDERLDGLLNKYPGMSMSILNALTEASEPPEWYVPLPKRGSYPNPTYVPVPEIPAKPAAPRQNTIEFDWTGFPMPYTYGLTGSGAPVRGSTTVPNTHNTSPETVPDHLRGLWEKDSSEIRIVDPKDFYKRGFK